MNDGDGDMMNDVPEGDEERDVALEDADVEPDDNAMLIMHRIADCPHNPGPEKDKYISGLMQELIRDGTIGACMAIHSGLHVRMKTKKKAAAEVRGARVEEPDFDDARAAELQSWIDTGTYVEVPDEGQPAITTRWVYSLKDDGTCAKARLVARGFQDQDVDILDTASPTCTRTNIRLALCIMAMKGWTPQSIDIKTAFLQGKELDRVVHLRPPSKHYHGRKEVLWRLRKPVYGLGDAPRAWFESFSGFLLERKGKYTATDPAFLWWVNERGELVGLMCIHVDDTLFGGTLQFDVDVVQAVEKRFPVGKRSVGNFEFIGLRIQSVTVHGRLEVHVSQNHYAEKLQEIDLSGESKQNTKLATYAQHQAYMTLVGELLWLTGQSRPDLAFLVMQLSQQTSKPTVSDLFKANFVLKRAKRDKVVFKYRYLDMAEVELLAYSDAAWANLRNGKTGGGYLIGLADADLCTYNIVAWRCRALRRVVRSTMAGETLALGDCLDEVTIVQDTWRSLTGKEIPTTARTDCKSLFDHVHHGRQVTEKRLLVELEALKEAQKEKKMRIEWVESQQQLADALTKSMVAHRLVKTINTGSLQETNTAETKQETTVEANVAQVLQRRTYSKPVSMGFKW